MVLLFIGPSGSGKDTQAEILAEKQNFDVISTGDLLRAEMHSGSELGIEIRGYVDQGKWAPDDITYKLLENYLEQNKPENIILTGAVRRESQIPLLNKALENQGLKLDKVVFFDLSDNEVMDRLSIRGRQDDVPENIQSRIQEFHDTTKPILEEYRRQGLLLSIDASPGIEDISSKLSRELGF
jgi:adenylate kinase